MYHINHGGCCYVAYCIAKLLEQDEVDFSLVVFDEHIDVTEYSDLFDTGGAMDHYGIVLKTSNELIPINCDDSDFRLYHQQFDVASYEILACYDTNWWNQYYDSNQNYKIQRLIEKAYDEFTKDLY